MPKHLSTRGRKKQNYLFSEWLESEKKPRNIRKAITDDSKPPYAGANIRREGERIVLEFGGGKRSRPCRVSGGRKPLMGGSVEGRKGLTTSISFHHPSEPCGRRK